MTQFQDDKTGWTKLKINLLNMETRLFPSVYEHEDEVDIQYVRIVWYSYLLALILCSPLVVIFLLQVPPDWPLIGALLFSVLASLIGLSLVKRQKVQMSVSLGLSLMYTSLLLGVLFESGLNDIGVQAFYPLLILVGLLMSRRSLEIFGGVTFIWLIALIYLESSGFYSDRVDPYSPLIKGLIISFCFMLNLIIIRFSVQRILLVNDQLKIAKQKAENANQLKSQFLATMSHELRTPLNAIIGYSEVILEEDRDDPFLGEDTVEDVTRIRKSGEALLSLINDILNLSRIEAGHVDFNIEEFDVASLMKDAIYIARPMLNKNGNSITFTNEAADTVISSDLQKVYQSLLNLLSNAAKYTENGAVAVLVSADSSHVAVSISDTGIGIAAEKIEHIFEPFYQEDGSLSRAYEGSGLGLAITKEFVEMLGGEILVESEVGKGTTFTVQLPRDRDGDRKVA